MTSAESSLYEVVNPATEEVIVKVELAGTSEADVAIARCRELGPDALDAFTETKNVFISTTESTP